MTIAGLVQKRRNRQTGTFIGVYAGSEAGFDTSGGKWSLVCEDHGYILAVPSLRLARLHATDPLGWCEFCNGNAHLTTIEHWETQTARDED